jgi:hypothetical protein
MVESSKKRDYLEYGSTEDQIRKIFSFWNDVMKLPTIGPMYAFSKEINAYANDFLKLGKIMAEVKTHMDSYWGLVNQAYTKASMDTAEHAPKQLISKDDYEVYRRTAIGAFEDSFTALFASPEFSDVYGKIFSSQLDLSRTMQAIAEKNFKTLNLPTRSEVDEILKDIAELKRIIRSLKRDTEMKTENDKARSATT